MAQTPWNLKIDEILKLGRIIDAQGNMLLSSTNIEVLRHIVECVNKREEMEK